MNPDPLDRAVEIGAAEIGSRYPSTFGGSYAMPREVARAVLQAALTEGAIALDEDYNAWVKAEQDSKEQIAAQVARVQDDEKINAEVAEIHRLMKLHEDGVLSREQARDLMSGDRHKRDESNLDILLLMTRREIAQRDRADRAEGERDAASAALAAVADAWNNPGPKPTWHYAWQERLSAEWPTLAEVVAAAAHVVSVEDPE